jgi:hypothetical protein
MGSDEDDGIDGIWIAFQRRIGNQASPIVRSFSGCADAGWSVRHLGSSRPIPRVIDLRRRNNNNALVTSRR